MKPYDLGLNDAIDICKKLIELNQDKGFLFFAALNSAIIEIEKLRIEK